MSEETNKRQVSSWRIKDWGRATVQVFGEDGAGTHEVQVRRVFVGAYDRHGFVVDSEVVEEDASVTNEQMSAAVLRVQEAMMRKHDHDQPGV